MRQVAIVYGEDAWCRNYSSFIFAVHPDSQGQGIGRAVQQYTVQKVNVLRLFPSSLVAEIALSGPRSRLRFLLYKQSGQCNVLQYSYLLLLYLAESVK